MKYFFWYSIILGFLLCDTTNVYAQPQVMNTTELLSDFGQTIPLRQLDKKTAIFASGNAFRTFFDVAERYASFDRYSFKEFSTKQKEYDVLILLLHNTLRGDQQIQIDKLISSSKTVIICRQAVQYHSWDFPVSEKFALMTYNSLSDVAQANLAMSVFGGIGVTQGKIKTEQNRIQYANNIYSGIDISRLTKEVDLVADEAIKQKATPGLVVMGLKNGKLIFEKSYGYHTYDNKINTKTTDLFDLASVSKISATTPVIMHLYDMRMIDLDNVMGNYLPEVRNTDKDTIKLRSVMLHEAGFTPYIPFYQSLKDGDVQSTRSTSHQVQLADGAFLRTGYYERVMWPEMMQSPLKTSGKYVYSDISMYVMKEVAEKQTHIPMDEYIQRILYRPIGMKTAGFNPRKRFLKDNIVPTQDDKVFRKTLLQGFVHDEGAAMAEGVAGHAGLFSSANDLAIFGQMLLNRGQYGGIQYFMPETIDLFTSKQSQGSRRGLGFDRADPDKKKAYPSKYANESVFGHTGYTGTCMWIDPQNQFVYIFLSNRVHPEVSDKLSQLNIRSRIMDAFYKAMGATNKGNAEAN